MAKGKKGQLMSQPLVYIFALIVGALILIWGVKSVYNMMEKADTLNTFKEIDALKHNIEVYAQYDKGNTKTMSMKNLPSKIEMFCFYDSKSRLNPVLDGKKKSITGLGYEGIVKTYFERKEDRNFLVLPVRAVKGVPPDHYVGPLRLEEGNPLCFKTKRSFGIEAMGGYVTIFPA